MVGGYIMISLNNINFDVETEYDYQTVPDIYERIEGRNKQAFLLGDFSIDGIEQPERFVNFYVDQGKYVTLIQKSMNKFYLIEIDDDDLIKVSLIQNMVEWIYPV